MVEEYIIPIIILVYCYSRIIWVLSKRSESKLEGASTHAQDDKFQLAKRNTIKTFLLVSICFALCWGSSQMAYLLFNLGYVYEYSGTYTKVSTSIAFLNCTINPFIYLIKYKDYQMALKSFLSCMWKNHANKRESQIMSRSGLTVSSTVG